MTNSIIKRLFSASVILFAASAVAQEDSRKGFWGEFGIGLTQVNWEQSEGQRSGGSNDSGLATTFKLGYGFSESFQLYYSNNVSWTDAQSPDGLYTDGLSAIGANIWVSPSFFVSAAYGKASLDFISTDSSFDSGGLADSGNGYSFGVGYEFAKHHNIKLNLIQSDLEIDEFKDYESKLFQLMYVYSLY